MKVISIFTVICIQNVSEARINQTNENVQITVDPLLHITLRRHCSK
jgi:hypothetical protein